MVTHGSVTFLWQNLSLRTAEFVAPEPRGFPPRTQVSSHMKFDRVRKVIRAHSKKLTHAVVDSEPKGKGLRKGGTADNTGTNEIRIVHTTQDFHGSKLMCPSMKSSTPLGTAHSLKYYVILI